MLSGDVRSRSLSVQENLPEASLSKSDSAAVRRLAASWRRRSAVSNASLPTASAQSLPAEGEELHNPTLGTRSDVSYNSK